MWNYQFLSISFWPSAHREYLQKTFLVSKKAQESIDQVPWPSKGYFWIHQKISKNLQFWEQNWNLICHYTGDKISTIPVLKPSQSKIFTKICWPCWDSISRLLFDRLVWESLSDVCVLHAELKRLRYCFLSQKLQKKYFWSSC